MNIFPITYVRSGDYRRDSLVYQAEARSLAKPLRTFLLARTAAATLAVVGVLLTCIEIMGAFGVDLRSVTFIRWVVCAEILVLSPLFWFASVVDARRASDRDKAQLHTDSGESIADSHRSAS